LTSPVEPEDFIVAVNNSVTLFETNDFTINYITNEITFVASIPAGTDIAVYNRNPHRFGWGQSASVYPHPEYPADSIAASSVLEANVNNLIDKTNIMSERAGSLVELTRVAQGATIYATDKSTIQDTVNNEVLAGGNYWANNVSTITGSVLNTTRIDPWNTQLVGIFVLGISQL